MHRFTVNYLAEDGPGRCGAVLNRGYFVHHVPRLILLCRLFGHRPVVDGTEGYREQPGRRWVVCDRCGVRPDPQGHLDPSIPIGEPYTGLWGEQPPGEDQPRARWEVLKALKGQHLPGPFPTSPAGAVGAHVMIGDGYGGPNVEVKVGNAGSEQVLAANVTLGRLGGLYLHTERHGTWLQRRLNPTGYVSRVTGVQIHSGHLWWRVWADRDGSSDNTPRWRSGSVRLDLRDVLLGERRYSYEDRDEPVTATVRMPHGDDHQVQLQLQRQTHGRARGRKRLSWTVDWQCKPGIPTKPGDRGRILGSGVAVPDRAVRQGTWSMEAAAAIAEWATRERTRYGFSPLEPDEVVV